MLIVNSVNMNLKRLRKCTKGTRKALLAECDNKQYKLRRIIKISRNRMKNNISSANSSRKFNTLLGNRSITEYNGLNQRLKRIYTADYIATKT